MFENMRWMQLAMFEVASTAVLREESEYTPRSTFAICVSPAFLYFDRNQMVVPNR